MLRSTWSSLVRSAWFSFVFKRLTLARELRALRRARRPRRRAELRPIVAAECLEQRQLLAAAITAVSPNSGQQGTQTNIVGSGFAGVTQVLFGSQPAVGFTVNSSSSITAMAPNESPGTVNIQVDTTTGNSPIVSADQFTYLQGAPTVTGVSPSSGSTAGGGSPITVTGTNFQNVSSVLFGSTAATSFTVQSSTQLVVTPPSHAAGAVDVIVVTSAGSSTANPSQDQYTFTSTGPNVNSISPNTGTGSGGTTVQVTGTGFTNVTAVTVGGTNATSFTVNSPTSLSLVTPSHTPGTADILITAAGVTSTAGSADQFTFTAPVSTPSVTGLSTTSGSTAGGNQVTILGTNFTNITAVKFGNVAATSFVTNSSTSITAVAPAESAGSVDITVTNSAGTSATSAADQYTFVSPAPIVSGLSTTSGSTSGGTTVVISGQNFIGATAVYFGTVAAQSFTVNSPNSITAVAPVHAVGAVDVTVRSTTVLKRNVGVYRFGGRVGIGPGRECAGEGFARTSTRILPFATAA